MYEMENPGYDLDNHRVATFLKKYVQGNTIAESRIQSVPGNATDGRANRLRSIMKDKVYSRLMV